MDLADAFAWPARDPRWIAKLLLMGLISLIPIVGAIALLGWMYATLDNLRQGRQELAGAGFPEFGRGLRLFLVVLVYMAALILLYLVFFVPLVLAGNAQNQALAAVAVGLALLANAVLLAASLAFYAAYAPIILAVDRRGFGGGLDVRGLWATMRSRPTDTLLAGLMALAAGFVAGLGALLCVVGIIFTIPYSYAILAAVLRDYERPIASEKRTGGEAA